LEFDYIIIGAGSAGCVVANRLTSNNRFSVCLLEAGGKDSYPWIHIPVGYFKTMGNPRTDWCYRTQPDAGLNGRSLNWPRGKTLGGSSSINGLLYVRGQPEDFEHWRQLGNEGWAWNDVLPYFKKSENWEGAPDDLRGKGGPIQVSKNRVDRDIVKAWLEAAVNKGYKWTDDYNQESQEGVGYFQMTMADGLRCSAAKAYLSPLKGNKNIEICTNAQTAKILIEKKAAIGVEVIMGGERKRIKARKEVILCAGTIGSPQLLMLSGLGDQKELSKQGIETLVHLPGVGKNLQDHLQARPVYRCNASTINVETKSLYKKIGMGVEYLFKRSGPMAMAASLGTGFLRTDNALDTPDIQYHIQPFSADRVEDGPHKFSAFTASVCQLRPESRGHLQIVSSNPEDYPKIYPNYLSTKKDCDTMVKAIQITREICQVEPVASLITDEFAPGKSADLKDYDKTLNWIRDTATTIYHPVGTCKMGKDKLSVVDAKLKVRGVDRLRVVDASIMPSITSGNTNAPTLMIGEKASDLIIKEMH
tara:strand:+ start:457 stop:2052 length:1596 start_codon:yes stop_codon:yes gene_type:complete